jgi:hypothetical protein
MNNVVAKTLNLLEAPSKILPHYKPTRTEAL